ncbi:MAG TPA: GNAT family N-acetyltransferase [Thermomicrobiales bacterium]|jgi:predicted N-acetyltransferase YhbS
MTQQPSNDVAYTVSVHTALTPEQRAMFDDLERAAFQWFDIAEEKQRDTDDRFCSDGDTVGYVFAFVGERLVGAVRLSQRAIDFHGRTVQLDGLGGVATDAAWRGRGVASATTAAAMGRLRELGCDLAYLCTDIAKLGHLYGQVGFVPLGRAHTYLGASDRRYTDDDGMIAPINSPDLFATILADEAPFDIGRGNW